MLQLITAPTEEPLTTDEAKLHLRVDPGLTADDARIAGLVVAARIMAEAELQRVLITQVWEQVVTGFPCRGSGLSLGLPLVTAVASVTYLDAAGASQVLGSSVYALDAVCEPARLVLKPDQAWPLTQQQVPNTVRVRFTAGWANAAAVPQTIKAWMLMQIGHLYTRREAAAERALEPLPGLDVLLAPHRVMRFV